MPTGNEQPPFAAKYSMKLPQENSPLSEDTGTISDSAKLSGTKRKQPGCPLSQTRSLPPGNTGSNGPLVYVRRKHETETSKVPHDNADVADSQPSRKISNDEVGEQKVQQKPIQETKVPHDNTDVTDSQPSRKISNGEVGEQKVQQKPIQETKLSSSVASTPSEKQEIEIAKIVDRENVDATDSELSRKTSSDGISEQKVQQKPDEEAKLSSSAGLTLCIEPETEKSRVICSDKLDASDSQLSEKIIIDGISDVDATISELSRNISSDGTSEQKVQQKPTEEAKLSSSAGLTVCIEPETETSKVVICSDKLDATDSQLSKKIIIDGISEQSVQLKPTQEAKLSSSAVLSLCGISEIEANSVISHDNVDAADSQKITSERSGKQQVQQNPIQGTKLSPLTVSASALPTTQNGFLGEPSNRQSHGKTSEQALPEPNHPPLAEGINTRAGSMKLSRQNWKERFDRLQTFLRNCDQANHEEYMQELRSLSAAGRNRHAVELEKKALQLFMEEGAELQRMRALNVLGTTTPTNQAPVVTTHTRSPMHTVSQTLSDCPRRMRIHPIE